MLKHKQMKHYSWSSIFQQALMNLIGDNGNTFKLKGSAADEDELMKEAKDISILKPALNLFQVYAMFYFGEHERIVKMIEKNGVDYFEKSLPGIVPLCADAFHSALSCISMVRRTGRSKYKKLAKKYAAKVKSFVEKGVSIARYIIVPCMFLAKGAFLLLDPRLTHAFPNL
jgi:hypothetical protein